MLRTMVLQISHYNIKFQNDSNQIVAAICELCAVSLWLIQFVLSFARSIEHVRHYRIDEITCIKIKYETMADIGKWYFFFFHCLFLHFLWTVSFLEEMISFHKNRFKFYKIMTEWLRIIMTRMNGGSNIYIFRVDDNGKDYDEDSGN